MTTEHDQGMLIRAVTASGRKERSEKNGAKGTGWLGVGGGAAFGGGLGFYKGRRGGASLDGWAGQPVS